MVVRSLPDRCFTTDKNQNELLTRRFIVPLSAVTCNNCEIKSCLFDLWFQLEKKKWLAGVKIISILILDFIWNIQHSMNDFRIQFMIKMVWFKNIIYSFWTSNLVSYPYHPMTRSFFHEQRTLKLFTVCWGGNTCLVVCKCHFIL